MQQAQTQPREINLLEKAGNAVWLSNAGRLLFGGSRNDPRGFAIYPISALYLEDESTEEHILETHPRWTDDGWIRGEFYIPVLGDSQHFLTRIGFIKPVGVPRTNGVTVRIIFNNVTLYDGTKLYDGHLEAIDVDLSRFSGEAGTLILEVGANGDSTQDWLVWINPRIGFP